MLTTVCFRHIDNCSFATFGPSYQSAEGKIFFFLDTAAGSTVQTTPPGIKLLEKQSTPHQNAWPCTVHHMALAQLQTCGWCQLPELPFLNHSAMHWKHCRHWFVRWQTCSVDSWPTCPGIPLKRRWQSWGDWCYGSTLYNPVELVTT